MSENELEKLAELIVQKQEHGNPCPLGMNPDLVKGLQHLTKNLTPEMLQSLKSLSETWDSGRQYAGRTILTFIIIGMIALFCVGVYEKLKSFLGK